MLIRNQAMTSFDRFCELYWEGKNPFVSLDISRMDIPADFFQSMAPALEKAFQEMKELEEGAIANPDENRQVGHYWLRNFDLVPDEGLKAKLREEDRRMRELATKLLNGEISPERADRFANMLIIGIGGSALGPQFMADAMRKSCQQGLKPFFFDNTDPDGFVRVLDEIKHSGGLEKTLCLVISKSGGTPETRNGMIWAENAFQDAGFSFGKHAIAITGKDSKLDRFAQENAWIDRLPMYDWVGGRTSVCAAVGLFPALLQEIDIDRFLKGAASMDRQTRVKEVRRNPAALLALAWHFATNGRGEKDMVILPYKDRLSLMGKYLQQLIMESIGKEKDLNGNVVNQGISVFGNKGSTDQHSYIQQLREGVNNFFATFVEVLRDGDVDNLEVEEGATAGDFLQGFYLGTRRALHEMGRGSITITVSEVNEEVVGALIALYERAVGFYASLVNINAYHQPGVEAGKKAAAEVLEFQKKLLQVMQTQSGAYKSAEEWASDAGGDAETTYKLLIRLSQNSRGIHAQGIHPREAKFTAKE